MSALQYNQPSTPNSFHHDEYKASYDDLLDENVSPYGQNAHHKTFTVDTTPSHHRGPSMPLSHKTHFSAKQSDDLSHDTSHITYPPLPVAKEQSSPSFWRKLLPESLACRLYVMTVLIETAIDLAIEGELLLRIQEENLSTSRTMPVYLSIFALAHVFQFAMAVDAVYARNTLQFICLTFFNALFLAYAIIQINEVKEAASAATDNESLIPINVLTTIIPIVISVAEVAYIGLGWKIYNEFGWKVYKFLGADRQRKKMYANYQVYECLIKFDVFFWAGFSVQFIWLVLAKSDWEYYVTFAALPLSLVLLVEGHLAARYENKMMMVTFISGCVGAMIYFIYKLIKVLLNVHSEQFKFVWKSLTIFSVIAIVLLLITFVYSIIVFRSFGRGLKEALARRNAQQHGRLPSQHHGRIASTHLNRMSIE
ncbi:hypothetical protein AMATHDRAFT_153213 [Amanita thiersii Skay4041]|uniref:Uncharacterized protein n=1 Tax=Amanita thiersii Skay4041 TaxID=703135 RepID=A0A2A9NFF8_9AGAR|nr:hypothetical protein AMATHDRAFT_153213 [Amanita thiersii Skay4041]